MASSCGSSASEPGGAAATLDGADGANGSAVANGADAGHRWTLIGVDGRPFQSPVPGTLGGHRGGKRYGRLDCPAALRAIARGGYVRHRVFFADEASAIAAGYRPCAACLPERHAAWKVRRGHNAGPRPGDVASEGAGRTATGMSR